MVSDSHRCGVTVGSRPPALRSEPIDTSELLAAATELSESLAELPLSLELPGAAEAGGLARRGRQQLTDYVIPRLRDVDAPMLAVVGGSTGAGKSTLVNSLVGAEVSRPGVLRPTTRRPVLVHHPTAGRWFGDARILGGLRRVAAGAPQNVSPVGELELVGVDTLPETIALLDAPDVDSVVDSNRELAAQLLAAADLWVFVTTAARYADAVPWTFLRSAVARGVQVAVVLNRVPPGAAAEVGPHLAEMLRAEGLGNAPVFTVDEQPLVAGRLPESGVQPLRSWLSTLASDQHARAEVIRRSLAGTIGELAQHSDRIAAAVDHQASMVGWLGDRVDEAFDRAAATIADDVRNGTVMRGEVLARWQELVGTGELLRSLQSTIGRLRDRVAAVFTNKPPPTERFQGAVTSGVEIVVVERTSQAVDEVEGHWRAQPAGTAVLASSRALGVDLRRPDSQLPARVARMVRTWQDFVLELLRREGGGKRNAARALSYGVNGLGAVLMVGVFAQTGGLTGAEVAIAGGSSAVGHKMLEAVLGDQAVRNLTAMARTELDTRIAHDVLDPERRRFADAIAEHRTGDRAAELRVLRQRLLDGVAG